MCLIVRVGRSVDSHISLGVHFLRMQARLAIIRLHKAAALID